MRYERERENHELFIRTTTTMRPNAPLRLSANILGKLFVEPRPSATTSSQKDKKVIAKNYADSPLSRSNVASASGIPSTAGIPAETVAEYRLRLVHYLALGPATIDEILKTVGGLEVDPVARQKILELLNEVCLLSLPFIE